MASGKLHSKKNLIYKKNLLCCLNYLKWLFAQGWWFTKNKAFVKISTQPMVIFQTKSIVTILNLVSNRSV